MFKLDGFFKHFTKKQNVLQFQQNITVVTSSQSDNHTVRIFLPFSVFVLLLKFLFSFEVTENIILSVTGLMIC